MRQIEDNSIDLIYIDPPFYTNEDYGDFKDIWRGMDDYLEFMKVRIREMYRILKESGSLYLHCDYHASHYLKIELDKIFGYKNFRNEIIWDVKSVSGFKSQRNGWIRSHDTIFYYVKSEIFTFNKLYEKYSENYFNNLKLKKSGKQYQKKNDKIIYKRYDGRVSEIDINRGKPISDVWGDIFSFQTATRDKEYCGYSTQKPNKLIERIIRSSSNEGDIVADFFSGSGTTLVVAKQLRRQFIGCDINEEAVSITKNRLENTHQFHNIETYLK